MGSCFAGRLHPLSARVYYSSSGIYLRDNGLQAPPKAVLNFPAGDRSDGLMVILDLTGLSGSNGS